jgi:hypothetical protein
MLYMHPSHNKDWFPFVGTCDMFFIYVTELSTSDDGAEASISDSLQLARDGTSRLVLWLIARHGVCCPEFASTASVTRSSYLDRIYA